MALVMLPMIATPSAPPISRVVSFIAEPTPAFSGGSDPMIESVAGAIARPMPTPMMTSTTRDERVAAGDGHLSRPATTRPPPAPGRR